MTKCMRSGVVSLCIVVCMISAGLAADRLPRLAPGVENLLVRCQTSGNLESFGKGLRGAVDHMIYDLQRAEFVKPSQYNEYGVGFEQDLGVVPEDKAAWWMAEWTEPIQANLIVLSGVYPNQPQPDTAWKIEIRHDGRLDDARLGRRWLVRPGPLCLGRSCHRADRLGCHPRQRVQQG